MKMATSVGLRLPPPCDLLDPMATKPRAKKPKKSAAAAPPSRFDAFVADLARDPEAAAGVRTMVERLERTDPQQAAEMRALYKLEPV